MFVQADTWMWYNENLMFYLKKKKNQVDSCLIAKNSCLIAKNSCFWMNGKYICIRLISGKFEVSAGILNENIYYIHATVFSMKVYFQNVHASVHNISLWENLAVGVLFIGKPWWMKGVAIMIFFLS